MIRRKLNVEVEADIFTEEDKKIYNKSIRELRNGEALDLDRAKKELLGFMNKQNDEE